MDWSIELINKCDEFDKHLEARNLTNTYRYSNSYTTEWFNHMTDDLDAFNGIQLAFFVGLW